MSNLIRSATLTNYAEIALRPASIPWSYCPMCASIRRACTAPETSASLGRNGAPVVPLSSSKPAEMALVIFAVVWRWQLHHPSANEMGSHPV